MFVAGNFVEALAQVLNTLITVYIWIIIIRVLISWVSPDPFNPLVQFLVRATDPVLEPARRIIPTIGPLDISPMIVLLLLQVIQHFLIRTLFDIAIRLR